jgi:hypothetical protein
MIAQVLSRELSMDAVAGRSRTDQWLENGSFSRLMAVFVAIWAEGASVTFGRNGLPFCPLRQENRIRLHLESRTTTV